MSEVLLAGFDAFTSAQTCALKNLHILVILKIKKLQELIRVQFDVKKLCQWPWLCVADCFWHKAYDQLI